MRLCVHPSEPQTPGPQDTISAIAREQRAAGVRATSLLNFVVSDGATLIATRFVEPAQESAATLYYAEGTIAAAAARDCLDGGGGVRWEMVCPPLVRQ